MSPRPLAVLVCVCAIGGAGAGCAKKRAAVEPLPPVTVAKSYPGKAAVDAMREALGKLRKKPEARAGGAANAAPRTRAVQPVGTGGAEAEATQPPRAVSSMGRDAAPPVPGPRVTPADDADTDDARGGMDPLAALIVGAWIALLVLLPLAIRYGWRG